MRPSFAKKRPANEGVGNAGCPLHPRPVCEGRKHAGNTVTINVFEAFSPKPVSTKGYTAAVLIVSGASRETLPLAPQGDNSLKGGAKGPIAAGATITLTIKTAEGKSGQVKFRK